MSEGFQAVCVLHNLLIILSRDDTRDVITGTGAISAPIDFRNGACSFDRLQIGCWNGIEKIGKEAQDAGPFAAEIGLELRQL